MHSAYTRFPAQVKRWTVHQSVADGPGQFFLDIRKLIVDSSDVQTFGWRTVRRMQRTVHLLMFNCKKIKIVKQMLAECLRATTRQYHALPSTAIVHSANINDRHGYAPAVACACYCLPSAWLVILGKRWLCRVPRNKHSAK